LQYLERVDLSHNKLAVFPNHLCEISDITEIVLDYNTIGDIPSEFGNIFSYLEVFTISHNRIARIPKSIGMSLLLLPFSAISLDRQSN
jgi:Leucine-rich repeat (LRR) protein